MDFKSAAEQQVRETYRKFCGELRDADRTWSMERKMWGTNLAVSKTAELMEMTAQRDEAQKALADANAELEMAWGEAARTPAESAEATIREQAERITKLQKYTEHTDDCALLTEPVSLRFKCTCGLNELQGGGQ